MRPTFHLVETGTTGRLAIMARPRGGEWLEDELRGLASAGFEVVVSLLTAEEESELELEGEAKGCEVAGLEFRSFSIPDRQVPALDGDTVRFITGLRDALAFGRSVVLHCRMGIGRSSLIAASVMKLLGVGEDEAFRRLSIARGLPVPDTEAQRAGSRPSRWWADLHAGTSTGLPSLPFPTAAMASSICSKA